jgi:hypothetical protein
MDRWLVEYLLTFAAGMTALGVVAKVTLTIIAQRKRAAAPELLEVRDRLARIEQAIDAMALEVERVSEAHRYTTRLLSERIPDPARLPRGGGQAITPH